MPKGHYSNSRRENHGESVNGGLSPEYRTFLVAKRRCRDRKFVGYENYGGRGIEFRFRSFEEFLGELGRKPTLKHTIERKDTDGHYERGNVKWATRREQNRNQRSNHKMTVNGETRLMCEWAEVLGISYKVIQRRLECGWCDQCACTQPLRAGVSGCEHKKKEAANV